MADKPLLILQVGTPRTASTTLQRHVLPRAQSVIALHKKAYSSCMMENGLGVSLGSGLVNISRIKCLETLTKILGTPPEHQEEMFGEGFSLVIAAARGACASGNASLFAYLVLQYSLGLYRDLALSKGASVPLVIAAERLSNHDFAINGRTGMIQRMTTLPVVRIIEAWQAIQTGAKTTARISACLREPIPHLASRYLRCCENRKWNGLRDLTVDEYVDRHASVHRHLPFATALFPVIHKEFINYHKQLGDVCAFGFRELLRSEDVFTLIGITEQEPLAFASLPHENQAKITHEDRKRLEASVTAALDRHGYLSIIKENQLFE